MGEVFTPDTEAVLAAVVADANAGPTPLQIVGGGTKLGLGRPVETAKTLNVSGLSGITLYEPGALTLVAKAGTPLAEVQATLQTEGQRLPFEPMDYRSLLRSEGAPTIGGTVAINNSGSRRIQAGACRDSLIGVRFVNGRGEVVKNGGRVMKNVTGLDLVKLMCGSYGTLGVLTELSFKVLPINEREATLVLNGLSVEDGVRALSAALGSPFEVTGAAHLPAAAGSLTALRVEGFAGQVDYRLGKLGELLGGDISVLEGVAHNQLWQRVGTVSDFDGTAPVWRISVKPGDAPQVVEVLRSTVGADVLLDWGGGLIWARVADGPDGAAQVVRQTVNRVGGHATLVRASDSVRASVPVFEPQATRLAQISADIRAKFDPSGVLNPGRMVA